MRSKDQILLESLYNNIIINEISSKYVDEVKDAIADNELPFNNITEQLIQFLDNNYEDLVNVMKLLAFRLFDLSSDYSKNLERVYGKFLI